MYVVPTVVELVLIFLIFLSVLVWAVFFNKLISFSINARYDRDFLYLFSQLTQLNELNSILTSTKGRLARMSQVGLAEISSWQDLTDFIPPEDKREILSQALRQQMHEEQTRMENHLSVLASVGATAPFIGLFGTVWGIMNALKAISATGSASLDVVAGPIGEALIATAVGIAAAVPAVLAYNYLIRKVRLSAGTMDNFTSAFNALALKSGFKYL